MGFLANLLEQGGAQIPANTFVQQPGIPAIVDDVGEEDIHVLGTRRPVSAPHLTAMPQTQVSGLPHKKPGIFRDILGVLGDALLVGNNAPAVYGPARETEEIANAMELLRQSKDPNTGGQAVFDAGMQMLNRINPEAARQYELAEAEQAAKAAEFNDKAARFQAQTALDNARLNVERFKTAETLGRYSRILNRNNWSRLAPLLYEQIQKTGLPFDAPPTTFNEDWVEALGELALKENDAQRIENQAQNVQSLVERRRAASAQGAARIGQGERRTRAQEANTASQITTRNVRAAGAETTPAVIPPNLQQPQAPAQRPAQPVTAPAKASPFPPGTTRVNPRDGRTYQRQANGSWRPIN